jgi:hypothetical protein
MMELSLAQTLRVRHPSTLSGGRREVYGCDDGRTDMTGSTTAMTELSLSLSHSLISFSAFSMARKMYNYYPYDTAPKYTH